MNNKYQYGIGPVGRWLIFCGIPMSLWAIFFAFTEPHHKLEHAVGEKAFPYILVGVPSALMIGGMVLYSYFPKRFIFPVGIFGWVICVSVLCWFFWLGPGSFGYHG